MNRVPQIIAAMKGRQAAAVNDSRLRDAVRLKLEQLANVQGRPLTKSALASYAVAVCQAAGRTIIFEDEVLVALEMGAAGEFDVPPKINQKNVAAWVTAYVVSGDRRAAQEQISLNAARDRRRLDSVTAAEQREDFERNGLRRAWTTFIEEGSWTFITGYGAALYDRIGRQAVRALLHSGQVADARVAALAAIRREYPQKYRNAPEGEIEATDVFKMHAKAQMARAYFEELRRRGLDITDKPAQL